MRHELNLISDLSMVFKWEQGFEGRGAYSLIGMGSQSVRFSFKIFGFLVGKSETETELKLVGFGPYQLVKFCLVEV